MQDGTGAMLTGAMTSPIDPALFRKVMGSFASGVTVVSTVADGQVRAMTVSAFPDRDAKNVAVEYDLQIVPVLTHFESHAAFTTPIDQPDLDGLGRWLDDRIVGFVETFMKLHENEHYTKDQYVEDPVAGVRFPKFAAGATLEKGGQTYYFIDEKTKAEFERKGAAKG